ncbi:Uncharacterized protein OBRU01_06225, partial [Operophtera brumata]
MGAQVNKTEWTIIMCMQEMKVVGAAHCIKSLFSQPLAITLQSGKFILREYGRYILAIGSDRNIPDWVLKNRASLLTSMIRVYHGDLQAIAAQMEDQRRLSEKLYQVFETYLPVLQFGCHIFQRILEHCRRSKGVLGGVVLYNNKYASIIATQLPASLTSYLTVVDPYRIKSPAETLDTDTPLPLGAQLLVVYVGKKMYDSLKKENQEAEREKFPQGGMKRDKSLLFTAVPEEDHNMISPPNRDENTSNKPPSMPDVVPFTNKPRPRPTKLSLSFKTQQSVDEETKENENVFTGQTSVCSTPMVEYKRLHGNMLSICQNPDTQPQDKTEIEPDVLKNIENSATVIENEKRDNKIVLDMNCIADHYINKPEPLRKLASVMDLQESFKRLSNRATSKFKLKRSEVGLNDDLTLERELQKSHSTMTINDPLFPVFRNDGVAISESLFNQYLEQHYSKMKQDANNENMFTYNMKICEQEKFEDFDSELTKSPQRTPKKIAKNTDQSKRKSLSLPLKSLNESSDSHMSSEEATSFKKKLSGVQLTPLMEKLSHLAFSDKSSGYSSRVMTPLEIREFMTPELDALPAYSERAVKCALFVSGLQNMALLALVDVAAANDADTINSLELDAYSERAVKCALFVSGLQNMALLVLVDVETANDADTINSLEECESDSHSEELDALPAYSERAVKCALFVSGLQNMALLALVGVEAANDADTINSLEECESDSHSEELDAMPAYSERAVKCALFVSGLQNMALLALVGVEAANDADTINSLWETSLNALGPIEQKCMDPLPAGTEATDYSYLTLDPDWGTVKKGGPWAALDIATMGLIHNEFGEDSELSEFIL